MSEWQQIGENLVRHSGGSYYLRAKVGGKVIRESLRTSDLRIAKIKRNERLIALRGSAAVSHGGSVKTIGDAVAILRIQTIERPNISPKTKLACNDFLGIMEKTLPLSVLAKSWTKQDAAKWWSTVVNQSPTGKPYSASVMNKLHGLILHLAGIMIEHGLRLDDPTRDLKRIPKTKIFRKMPSRPDLGKITDFIRSQKKRGCVQSSQFVGFMGFTGMRKGELAYTEWKHIDENWVQAINIKSKSFRPIPINESLRSLIAEIKLERKEINPNDKVFAMKCPRRALDSACKGLNLPRMRPHDLRHFFATWALESGVDPATLAKWLGHADGGALVMNTYGHVRNDHSLESAKKLV